VGHGFGRLQRIGACALQLEKDLAVWKAALEPVHHYQGQGGLADAASSPQPGDGCTSIKGLQNFLQFFSSSGEICGGGGALGTGSFSRWMMLGL